ncbi:MAG: hypothetical protein E7222_13115 [Clostridiales bacterium]|nr:hypothetical protein [Clostridiales bacterium]
MGRMLKRVPMDFPWPIGEVWEGYFKEPPEGDGYQLWENTSEGSPISPVFDSLDGLCEWAVENETVFASFTATKEEWKEMLSKNQVYAMVQLDDGGKLIRS